MVKKIYSGVDEILAKLEKMGYDIDYKHPIETRGRASHVYKAVYKGEKRFIKIMDFKKRLDRAQRYQELINEFRPLSRNDKNCLVEILEDEDVSTEDAKTSEEAKTKIANVTYTVMECGDFSLEEMIEMKTMTPNKAVKAAKNTATALNVVANHKKGWVHRDVKPANIIVFLDHDSDDKKDKNAYKLSDFHTMSGIDKSEELSLETINTTIQGTPGYLAPELDIVEARNPDVQARDVYSLGIVLYQSLTNKTHEQLMELKPAKEGEDLASRYGRLQQNPEEFFKYLGLEPEKQGDKDFKPVIENIILREITKKCLAFDKKAYDIWKAKPVAERELSGPNTPWHGRYAAAEALFADLEIAEYYDDFESIIRFMKLDLDSSETIKIKDDEGKTRELGVVEARREAQGLWKYIFTEHYKFKNGDFAEKRRRKNRLLNLFEDEEIVKRIYTDRERIDKFFEKYSKKQTFDEVKDNERKGISLQLENYAKIWEIYDDLLKGYDGKPQERDFALTKDLKKDETAVKRLNDLSEKYDPKKHIKNLCAAEIKNEYIAAEVKQELEKELEKLISLGAGKEIEAEKASESETQAEEPDTKKTGKGYISSSIRKIGEKLKEIDYICNKAERACRYAKKLYARLSPAGEFNSEGLGHAIRLLDKEKYSCCKEFYQVAAAKAELISTDIIQRKLRRIRENGRQKDLLKQAAQELDKIKDKWEQYKDAFAFYAAANRAGLGDIDSQICIYRNEESPDTFFELIKTTINPEGGK